MRCLPLHRFRPALAATVFANIVLASAVFADGPDGSSDDGAEWTEERAVEFSKQYCVDCHQGEDAEWGLDLAQFTSQRNVIDSIDAWKRIVNRVSDSQMPPLDSDQPDVKDRIAFVGWINRTIHTAVCDDGVSPGGAMIRRLNRTEYSNTMRDLLGIHVDAGHVLPDDGAGGEGFDNAAETLFISPIYAEKYLEAARSAIQHALKDPDDYERLIVVAPSDSLSPNQAARTVLEKFLPRAFRRAVGENEIGEYLQLFDAAFAEDDSYVSAIEFTLVAALVSPKFLFLYEEPPVGDEMQPISDYELASRLSYFLWASMPDEELLQLARDGKLHQESVLNEQVKRMLRSRIDRQGLRRDSKVRGFATSFVEQWLGTRALGREFKPDPSVESRYDSELEGGMKYEPIFFLEDLLADDRSLLNLIDSDFTYVNRRLATHYRVGGSFREQPKRVELDPKDHRGGLLGMSAVLAVSSLPHRTSPVLRGKWILETMLGTPPPPPPPNVPGLDETTDATVPASLRERLELHRSNPTCASCHDLMDPIGFGLENYDVLGRWRTVTAGKPIDASGNLPGGVTFGGPVEMKARLMERKDQFIRHLTPKMLGYALARGLTPEDDCVVDSIAQSVANNDYKAQTLVTEIVKSIPFRYKLADQPAEKTEP